MDRLRDWFARNGGAFHPAVTFAKGPFGISVYAQKRVEDTTIVTCPLDLVITYETASRALNTLLGDVDWSERQLICSYLCLHHITDNAVLRHRPYVECLPPMEDLLTPLHFTPQERELFRGTNLYGATLDRERDWRAEWVQCHAHVQRVQPGWADAFTWQLYLTASTHLSSRAFPSSILSPTPTLVTSPSTHPVLIPGLDLLNHKRAQPVSWIVSPNQSIALVAHPTPESDDLEVFNNYGPKPNDELILGYGFSIPDNPDDTMTLQIGGTTPAQKWVIGRHAHGVDGLWSDVRSRVVNGENQHAFEDDLDAAAVLTDMVQAKLDGIRHVGQSDQVRPAVRAMVEHYTAGQRDILEHILAYAARKQQEAIESAREQGIDLVFDDDE